MQAGDYEKVPIEVRDANKEKVRIPWGLCGKDMGLMWGGHGAYVGRPWGLCGEAMGLMWGGHGAYVGRPWGLCGEAMELMWGGHGAYVGRPWGLCGGLCGEAMGLMWGGHGAYVGRPWDLCGEAMGLMWVILFQTSIKINLQFINLAITKKLSFIIASYKSIAGYLTSSFELFKKVIKFKECGLYLPTLRNV